MADTAAAPLRPKISEKIAKAAAEKKPFFSFEYFVPKTPEGILNLYGRIQRMGELGPLFIDVTWGAVRKRARLFSAVWTDRGSREARRRR
jgi:5,10-methylenetetrahydrofolate reductase